MSDVFAQLEAWEAEALKIENRKLKAEIVTLTQYQGDMYRDYLTECNALHEKIKELEAAYSELIMEVATKVPNESCHDTAKRYIREREHRTGGIAEAVLKEGKDESIA